MKFDIKLIGYITTFENFTRTTVKDCFFRDKELIFIVDEGQLGKALGKSGINVKKLGVKMKRRLRIIMFDKDPVKFLKNLLYPLNGYEVIVEDLKLILKPSDNKVKGQIYGRERSNFNWIKSVLNRHFKNVELVMG